MSQKNTSPIRPDMLCWEYSRQDPILVRTKQLSPTYSQPDGFPFWDCELMQVVSGVEIRDPVGRLQGRRTGLPGDEVHCRQDQLRPIDDGEVNNILLSLHPELDVLPALVV